MGERLEAFWRRLRVEVARAWADTNQANALLAERRQTIRPAGPMRWVDTMRGPRLVGSVLPTPPRPTH